MGQASDQLIKLQGFGTFNSIRYINFFMELSNKESLCRFFFIRILCAVLIIKNVNRFLTWCSLNR